MPSHYEFGHLIYEDQKQRTRSYSCPPYLADMVEQGSITITDAWLLMVIDSFVWPEEDCYKTNEELGKQASIKTRSVSKSLSKLKKMGLVIESKNDGRRRFIHTHWSRPQPPTNRSKDLRH